MAGSAAVAIWCDVALDAKAEFDDWHAHEHQPERLSIPGFLRGSRWVSHSGPPRYLVLYEVEALSTLTSDAYLARLNNPSAWTSTMMPHYRGMRRGFCTVSGSFGFGLGQAARQLRFRPAEASADALRANLLQSVLPSLPSRRGLSSVHLLEGAATPPMTAEQRIRGVDAGVDWALLVTAYESDALADLDRLGLSAATLAQQGASDVVDATYQLAHALSHVELAR